MGTRRKSRELALQMLYQADLGEQQSDEVRKTFWQGRGEVDSEVQGFAVDRLTNGKRRDRKFWERSIPTWTKVPAPHGLGFHRHQIRIAGNRDCAQAALVRCGDSTRICNREGRVSRRVCP